MLQARYAPYRLLFKEPSGTSRGVMTYKDCYMVQLYDDAHPNRVGWGECALFRGLGSDDNDEDDLTIRLIEYSNDEYRKLAGERLYDNSPYGILLRTLDKL